MRTALFRVITQGAVVIFLPTFRDNLSGLILKGNELACPETSAINCHYLLRDNSEGPVLMYFAEEALKKG